MSLSSLVPLTLQPTAQPASVLVPPQTTPKHAMGIQALPSAVFGRILSFLPAREITRTLHHVCQDWRNLALVNDGCLDLSELRDLSDSGLKTILDKASGTRITSISLSNCKKITDAGLAHLAELPSLYSLNLSMCDNITDAGLAHLAKLTLLSSLDLRRCTNITDAGIAHLSKLALLSSLNLSICPNITDVGLAHLATLTLLSSLDLSGWSHIPVSSRGLNWNENITDAGLAHLSKLTALRSLNLSACINITDAGLAHLATLTSLSSLLLDYPRASSDAARAFNAKLIPVEFKDVPFRDKMDYYIYMLASQPKGGDEWGKKNRYVDFDRLKLAQALANLELSRPVFFKEQSIEPLLDLINQLSSTDQLDQSLNKLPEETRNAIFYQVYQQAPEPKGGDQWGEKHRFDDLAWFRLAVIEVIKSRVLYSMN